LVTLALHAPGTDTSVAGGTVVSARSLFHRRDPFWETDGPAARREQRRRRSRGVLALATAVAAVAVTAFAWTIQLGIAAALGIGLTLPLR
jgi:hypothetical protein